MEKKNTIRIYDFDGTLVDSNPITQECRVIGLTNLTGKPRSQVERDLDEKGLEGILKEQGIDSSTFFKKHYKTFDPYEAKKQGKLYIFPDAKEALEHYTDRSQIVISNSGLEATHKKIDALDMTHYFNHVFAEFEKGKAKPAPYMGEKALDELSKEGALNGNPKILLVGDAERDLQFGENFKQLYRNSVNILIDRLGTYKGSKKPDKVIRSLTQLGDYE